MPRFTARTNPKVTASITLTDSVVADLNLYAVMDSSSADDLADQMLRHALDSCKDFAAYKEANGGQVAPPNAHNSLRIRTPSAPRKPSNKSQVRR